MYKYTSKLLQSFFFLSNFRTFTKKWCTNYTTLSLGTQKQNEIIFGHFILYLLVEKNLFLCSPFIIIRDLAKKSYTRYFMEC